MYDYYDYLDFSICREIAYSFFPINSGDFKVHIQEVLIERDGQKYKISRPPTIIKDILRFSISTYNDVTYCFYSVKTPLSILGKLQRDISIEGEFLPKDPLNKDPFYPNRDVFNQFKNFINKREYYFENELNKTLLLQLIFKELEKNRASPSELSKDLSELFTLSSEISELETRAYNLVAELESIAFLTKKDEYLSHHLTYSELFEKFGPTLKELAKGFRALYNNFLEGRKNKSLPLADWLNFNKIKPPLKQSYFKEIFEKIKKDKEDFDSFSKALDGFYLSSLGQLDTISSSRRHLLRAIVMVVKDLTSSSQWDFLASTKEFIAFKNAAKKYEKCSTLLLKGFSSTNKLKSYLFLVDFLNSYSKVFNSSLDFLNYIEKLKKSDKNLYYQLAEVKKCLIFYMQYISFRDLRAEKESLDTFAYLIKKYKGLDLNELFTLYYSSLVKANELANSFYLKGSLEGSIDPIKIKRKEIALKFLENLKKLKRVLPIHYNLVKFRYSVHESHTNYKFGPWFDNIKTSDLFNPELLLVSSFYLLKRAIGEKQSLKEKMVFLNKSTDQKLRKRVEELNSILGFPLNLQSEKEQKNQKFIAFGRLNQDILQDYLDKVSSLYEKLSTLNKEFYLVLEKISKKYLDFSLKELLFPEYAAPFYYYEKDIQDQLQLKKRQKNSFANIELKCSLIIKQRSKRNFSQDLILDFSSNVISYNFKGKDPTRLSIPSANRNSFYGTYLEIPKAIASLTQDYSNTEADKLVFSTLPLIPEILNIRLYLLNKIFKASDARYCSEHLNLFLGLLKDATSSEKGCFFSYNNKIYEFSPNFLDRKFNEFKLDESTALNIEKNRALIEKERILFTLLKQATRAFEARRKAFAFTLQKLNKIV